MSTPLHRDLVRVGMGSWNDSTICLTLPEPGFQKLAQTGGGADYAPSLNFAPLNPN